MDTTGKRNRVPTEKGLALQKANQIKDKKAKERALKKLEAAQTQEEVDDLAAAFEQMGMGRRKKTKKHTKKYRRKTNRR